MSNKGEKKITDINGAHYTPDHPLKGNKGFRPRYSCDNAVLVPTASQSPSVTASMPVLA